MHGHHADARRRIVKMAINAAPAIMIPVHRASGFRGYDQLYESKKIVGVAVMKASSSLENFPFVIYHSSESSDSTSPGSAGSVTRNAVQTSSAVIASPSGTRNHRSPFRSIVTAACGAVKLIR